MATRKKTTGKRGSGDEGKPSTDIVTDAHDSLVKSLESIKELLLKSESKISAARESIARADMPRQERPDEPGAEDADDTPLFDLADSATTSAGPVQGDDDVAEEDIDAFLSELGAADPHGDDDVPMLEDVVVPGRSSGEEAMQDTGTGPDHSPTLSGDAIEDIMNEFQKNLEKKIHDTLIQVIVQLESELKAQIREEIEELRQQLQNPPR
ncbi:MAG TPA: hypothetical protein ENJ01_12190 [Gammaproteobacteria bacterium]|nr:hypothetical protein [Gammaproteobacteria bacterium]